MPFHIHPQEILADPRAQARGETCEETVKEYAEAMDRGDEFPAITVFYDTDSGKYYLADGFHRLAAHRKARPNDPIMAVQKPGAIEAAAWHAIGANRSHGYQRTAEQKRHAVRMAILHPRAREMSRREIARYVGVNRNMVREIHNEMEAAGEIPSLYTAREKAIMALSDPANEGKSNREVATVAHVGEGTVRAAREEMAEAARNGRKCQIAQREPKPNLKPVKRCCGCSFHDRDTCTITNKPRAADDEACESWTDEDFSKPDPADVKIIEPKPKGVTMPRGEYKPRNAVTIDFEPDNPDAWAVLNFNQFDREFIVRGVAKLNELLKDPDMR